MSDAIFCPIRVAIRMLLPKLLKALSGAAIGSLVVFQQGSVLLRMNGKFFALPRIFCVERFLFH